MRKRRAKHKLQRKSAHRNLMLANQVCSLVEHKRIRTTLAKAKAVKPLAEKMVTLAKRGDLHARRQAVATLGNNQRAQRVVKVLFGDLATACSERTSGYTRIMQLGPRQSDSAPMALIEWVDFAPTIESDEDDENES